MSKADCKCKEVECEECPEWIFTLADLIMCMMGLFVISVLYLVAAILPYRTRLTTLREATA